MPTTHRTRIVAGLGATCLTLGTLALPTPAHAAFTPDDSALAVAQAIAVDPALVTGASFVTRPMVYDSELGVEVIAPTAGVATDALGQFPRAGNSYGVLSSGDIAAIPQPGTFADSSFIDNPRGASDHDVTVLKVDFTSPTGANCLAVDFKFLSEEYPTYVGSPYNDAFIAELDQSTWTTTDSEISAPDNFAFDEAGNVVSINSTGLDGMSPQEGAGTAFDGPLSGGDESAGAATTLLSAATPVTVGAHSLYLSIFDQGDQSLDSAVFLDNLRVFTVPNPATDCVAGAQVVTHTMTLAPATGSQPVGTSHTLTASVKDANGDAISSGTVEFTVTGAHTTSGSASVAAGQATWNYPGTVVGDDQITACYKPTGATECTALAYAAFTWTPAATLPVVSVDPTTYSVAEGVGTASVTVTLSAAASGPVTVAYATADGTATAGSDYTAASGTLTIPAGSTSGTIDVPIIDDSVVEASGTFTVTLSNPTGATLGAAIATVTITDDDVPPVNPAPVVDAGPAVSGVEGSPIGLAGTATDTEALTVSWAATPSAGVDAGATCTFANPAAASTTVTCTDDGVWTLTLTASDGTNPPVSDTTTLTVANAAPTVSITSPTDMAVVPTTGVVTLRADVADPGINDVLTCTVDWGDGTTSNGTVSSGVCTATHTYAGDGAWDITVTVTDDDGVPATDSIVLVTASKSAKVTGGGFITTDGRVSFGFVAKADAGSLEGQLQLRSGKNKFHGTSVTELVVEGNTATWSGTGRWNKADGYSYTVTVVDNGTGGNSNNGKGKGAAKKGDPDTFAVTVKASDGSVVFSSAGPLQGGNVTVH